MILRIVLILTFFPCIQVGLPKIGSILMSLTLRPLTSVNSVNEKLELELSQSLMIVRNISVIP